MELLIQLGGPLGGTGRHLLHHSGQLPDLLVGDAPQGQQGGLQLQARPQLPQPPVVDLLQEHQQVKGVLQIALDVAADKIAGPLVADDKSHMLQQPNCLPHRVAADAQLLGQLPLGGKGSPRDSCPRRKESSR